MSLETKLRSKSQYSGHYSKSEACVISDNSFNRAEPCRKQNLRLLSLRKHVLFLRAQFFKWGSNKYSKSTFWWLGRKESGVQGAVRAHYHAGPLCCGTSKRGSKPFKFSTRIPIRMHETICQVSDHKSIKNVCFTAANGERRVVYISLLPQTQFGDRFNKRAQIRVLMVASCRAA